MTHLLAEAFREVEKLPEEAQNQLAEQLLHDITNEPAWQERLSNPEPYIEALERLAAQALAESDARLTKVIVDENELVAA